MLYGYARVSTAFQSTKDRNQTFDRQEKILKDNGVKLENIFCDRITGGSNTKDRQEYDKLMKIVVPGDMIYVSEMSRFSRSVMDLCDSVNLLMKKQIGIKFIKEGIEIGSSGLSPLNKFIFQLFGAFNELEKSLIAERVSQGMQASKEKGTKLGRPTKLGDVEQQVIRDYLNGYKYVELEAKYEISRPTLARIVRPYSNKKSKGKRAYELKKAEEEARKNDLL